MNNSLIHYKIISAVSFNAYEKPAIDALTHIRRYIQDKSAWLYINMQYKKIEDLTMDAFRNADSITVTDSILGG
jgi:hypothetical protein